MTSGLDGRVILVTGACGDLGQAITGGLRRAGATVVASDLLPPEAARQALGADPGPYIPCDVRQRAQVEAMVARILTDHGRVDGLVAAAGIVRWAEALEVSSEVWDQVLGVNLTGTFITAQVVAEAMRQRRSPGSMVFIGSWIGESPARRLLPYCVSKAGVDMVARCLALELAPLGIRVNVVAPGVIDAGVSGRIFAEAPERRAALERVVPLGQLGSAQQVAECVTFLLSGAAGYVTGANLVVDGGIRLAHDGG